MQSVPISVERNDGRARTIRASTAADRNARTLDRSPDDAVVAIKGVGDLHIERRVVLHPDGQLEQVGTAHHQSEYSEE